MSPLIGGGWLSIVQRLDPRRNWEPWGGYHDYRTTGSPGLQGAESLTADAILTESAQRSTHQTIGRGVGGSGSGASHGAAAVRAARRRLQDAPGGLAEETEVRTAEELRRAVARGRPRIVVLEHMDLASLAPLQRLRVDWALGFAPTTVHTIRGNCTEAPAGVLAAVAAAAAAPPLLPLRPGQCLLTSPVNVLAVRGQLWMDNLYLRAAVEGPAGGPSGAAASSAHITGLARARRDAPAREPADGAAATAAAGAVELVTVSGVPGGAELWLTRCTLQGTVDTSGGGGGGGGAAAAAGLQVTGKASADGCTFANLGGGRPPVSATGAGSSAAFTNCTFSATSTTDLAPPAAARSTAGPAAVSATDAAAAYSVALGKGTAVRLEGCAFAEGAAAAVRVGPQGGAAVYSNADSIKVQVGATRKASAAKPLTGIVDVEAFLGREDAWLVKAQKAVGLTPPPSAAVAPAPQQAAVPVPLPAPMLAPTATAGRPAGALHSASSDAGVRGAATTAAAPAAVQPGDDAGSKAGRTGANGAASSVPAGPLWPPATAPRPAAVADTPEAGGASSEQARGTGVRSAAVTADAPAAGGRSGSGGAGRGQGSQDVRVLVGLLSAAAGFAVLVVLVILVSYLREAPQRRSDTTKAVLKTQYSSASSASAPRYCLRELSPLTSTSTSPALTSTGTTSGHREIEITSGAASGSMSLPPRHPSANITGSNASHRDGHPRATEPSSGSRSGAASGSAGLPPRHPSATGASAAAPRDSSDVVLQAWETPGAGRRNPSLSHSMTLPLPPAPLLPPAGVGMHDLLDAASQSAAGNGRSAHVSPALTHTDISETLDFMVGPPSLDILKDLSHGIPAAPSSELYSEDLPGTSSYDPPGGDSYHSSPRTVPQSSQQTLQQTSHATTRITSRTFSEPYSPSGAESSCSCTCSPLFSPCASAGHLGRPLPAVLPMYVLHPGFGPGSEKGAVDLSTEEDSGPRSGSRTDVSVTLTSATTETTAGHAQTALTVCSAGESTRHMRAGRALRSDRPPPAASAAQAARAARVARDTRVMKRRYGPASENACLDRLAFISAQLESYTRQRQFMPGLVLLGHGRRRQGGQAIVQIARVRDSGREVAVKLYASRRGYESDSSRILREDNPLHSLMPRVRRIYPNADVALRDVCGNPLPPFIVMDKGEPLDTYCGLHQPRRSEAFKMILSIGRVLADLHASGHVHRDLDPRHIMWLPQEHRWTLSGLSSVARIGGAAPLPDTLSPAKRPPSVPVYAAPEAVTAARRGDAAMPTTDALDAWALGVLVIELLAGQSVFKRSAGRDAVMAHIAGDGEALPPWEEAGGRSLLLATLGPLRDPVLSLLCRDPARRLSIAAFLEQCECALAER